MNFKEESKTASRVVDEWLCLGEVFSWVGFTSVGCRDLNLLSVSKEEPSYTIQEWGVIVSTSAV